MSSTTTNEGDMPAGFFIVAREPGAEHPALPTWANREKDPAHLAGRADGSVVLRPITSVPGAFHLLNVLSREECESIVKLTEGLGYLPDAAVSLPRSVRHNDNVTWVADQQTVDQLWLRCEPLLADLEHQHFGKPAVGLNARFRFYRYSVGDYFKPHTDGAWPGSAVIDDQLITDAYGDRYSQLSFVLFLSDGFDGGRTEFFVDRDQPQQPARDPNRAKIVQVATPIGAAICFPHGLHPLHCLHSSETITRGTKYIVRTDILCAL